MDEDKNIDKLLDDAIVLLEKSKTLKDAALWLSKEIEKGAKAVSEDKFDVMSWEEKEKSYKKLDELMGRLNAEIKILITMDAEYRKIAERVNKMYGREVMEILPPLKFESI